MPRVYYVKRARRDYSDEGIRRGESYYWWKFKFGSKQRSKTPPQVSQLTQSEFWSTLYSIQESTGRMSADNDIQDQLYDLKSDLEQLRDETQEKADNQPESMSDGPVAELLNARVEALDDCILTLEGWMRKTRGGGVGRGRGRGG